MKKLLTYIALTLFLSLGSCSSSEEEQATSCCKVCSTGKACGDSCISRSYNCSQPAGCACDAE